MSNGYYILQCWAIKKYCSIPTKSQENPQAKVTGENSYLGSRSGAVIFGLPAFNIVASWLAQLSDSWQNSLHSPKKISEMQKNPKSTQKWKITA